jgi:hypothetical protein
MSRWRLVQGAASAGARGRGSASMACGGAAAADDGGWEMSFWHVRLKDTRSAREALYI